MVREMRYIDMILMLIMNICSASLLLYVAIRCHNTRIENNPAR